MNDKEGWLEVVTIVVEGVTRVFNFFFLVKFLSFNKDNLKNKWG